MAITYHPRPGEIFICSYPKDMIVPEMIKTRPVVVVSPKLKHRNKLVTIVPLSTTTPKSIESYHYQLSLNQPLPFPWDTNPCWVICDHPMTVSFDRLDLIRLGKDQYGKRKYLQYVMEEYHLNNIRLCIKLALSLP